MSDRERWIVYPLLFLSIGFSIRSGVQIDEDHDARKHAESDILRCRGLEVVDAAGQTKWVMRTTKTGEGLLELSGDEGKLAARLTSNPTGALLSLFNRTGELALQLGYESQQVFMIVSNRLAAQFQVFRLPILPPPDRESANQKSDDEPAAGATPSAETDHPNKSDAPPTDSGTK